MRFRNVRCQAVGIASRSSDYGADAAGQIFPLEAASPLSGVAFGGGSAGRREVVDLRRAASVNIILKRTISAYADGLPSPPINGS
ncbi:hypothetical protein EAH79_16880 [Sphingomonas koreensis]|nr:hypothetical protein EAH79_16880 [Sphingomonas koreensis]